MLRHKIRTDLIVHYWDIFMRIAGSLQLGTVNPTQFIQVLQHELTDYVRLTNR
ncbi:Tn3 family transposase [Bacillus bombysepticus]|uniref:Tn3 family transposase n=1 Tax=Bacillus bombysepticus TaxID=658666 RepID=UPI00301AAC5E